MSGIYIALKIKDMDQIDNKITNSEPAGPESDRPVFCKIFSDWVSRHLCDIRRKELIAQGSFSCEGCPNFSGNAVPAGS